jgi:glycosyltransferase involved in cell wall biosynthesis
MVVEGEAESAMTKAYPLVSVVIPCYNQGRFLDEAIQSCLWQTNSRIEIVVINDGSVDNTSAVAASYLKAI